METTPENCAVSVAPSEPESSTLFPSMRLMMSLMLCSCFITLSIASSNMAVALVCMTSSPKHGYGGDLKWNSEQEGMVLAAQNVGWLLTVVTGMWADRLNGKWMVLLALSLCCLGNVFLPLFAYDSFWFAIAARFAVGTADACLIPATNSLITRWFPQSERAAAVGLIYGGRQIGMLYILPTAGYLCTRKDIIGGWPAIFYLSASTSGTLVMVVFRIACESIGKRTDKTRTVPYRSMMRSPALWAAIFAYICHEYPLVIMSQFLPNYMRDVLEFSPTKNGLLAALPYICLFLSKTFASSFASYLIMKRNMDKTFVCKIFNGVASAGLAVSIFVVPYFDKNRAWLAVVSLCSAMFFAGIHTPGVMTAIIQLAPPFSGIITGWTVFAVACSTILNKMLTKFIVQHGTSSEWALVFRLSALVAALPVGFFSIWGSADRQIWASPPSNVNVCSFAEGDKKLSVNLPTQSANRPEKYYGYPHEEPHDRSEYMMTPPSFVLMEPFAGVEM